MNGTGGMVTCQSCQQGYLFWATSEGPPGNVPPGAVAEWGKGNFEKNNILYSIK